MRQDIKIDTKFGDTLYGYAWTIEEPKANVIIVTGMEEYALRYDEFAQFLNSHGYDVFCVDHYGQGLNAKTPEERGVVPTSFFSKSVKNLDQIVSSCRQSLLPTTIIAHSMGSFMLQDYIQRFTEHINKVVLVGSNGPNGKFAFHFGKFASRLTLTKKNRNNKHFLLNKLIFGMYSKHFKDRKTESDWISLNEDNVSSYVADEQCGYISSHGFFFEFMKGCCRLYHKKFLKKIRKDMNILIVAGDDDPVGAYGKGPMSLFKMYKKLGIENVQLELYENLRHEILNEKNRQEVYDDILAFLDKEVPPAEFFIK